MSIVCNKAVQLSLNFLISEHFKKEIEDKSDICIDVQVVGSGDNLGKVMRHFDCNPLFKFSLSDYNAENASVIVSLGVVSPLLKAAPFINQGLLISGLYQIWKFEYDFL